MSGNFREFVLEEGEVWDALKIGVKTGMKAYRQQRTQQKTKNEQKVLMQRLMSAEGNALDTLVKQAVEQGYTVKNGEVVKAAPVAAGSNDWLKECTIIRKALFSERLKRTISSNSAS